MNVGKTLFSQLMDFLSWTTFTRIVERHGGGHYMCALQKSLAGGTVLQVYQAASAYQKILRQLGECGEVANLDRHVGLCPRCHRQEATQSGRLALHFVTDIVPHPIREDALAASVSGWRLQNVRRGASQPIESILILTGQQ